jgi:archaellum biogenesis ATPase FlaH
MLNPARGDWAKTMNAWLGVRGGLMPGKALLIGGAAGGGKTSLASAFAWDALKAGCPVTLYQLELSRWAAVEYLLRQDSAGVPPLNIFGDGLPSHWKGLLDVPADPSPNGNDAENALRALARKAERLRKVRGDDAHAANGLFIVDYVQLFAKASGDAFHEALASTVSRLVKTAAMEGVCLVLASQVNKKAQDEELSQTAFAGADLARMPDVAVTIEKATVERGKFVAATASDDATEENGYHARLIKRQKERGQLLTPRLPDATAGVWLKGGTLRGESVEAEKPSTRRDKA